MEVDAGCPILHVDMDAFYASVEVRRRPELRGKPVVVGGAGPRGVVSSASYEARRFGIRSAMPGMQARAKCPHAIFLPVDMREYISASRQVMGVFRDVTPLVEPLSVDEAFLDVSGAMRLFGSPAKIAADIRARMADELRLTCSIGVAPNKFLAKLGSTRAKPDGMIVIPVDKTLEFLHPLPVSALWGVGERTQETLRRLGLTTVADVANASVSMLRSALGQALASHLHELSWARDSRRVTTHRVEKSIGSETTFDVDQSDPAVLRRTLLSLSQQVAKRAREGAVAGRTIAVKVRFADFRTISRSRTLPSPTDVAQEVYRVAWELFEPAQAGQRIRLAGVRLEGLVASEGSSHQLALDEPAHGWRDAEVAADAVAARFGKGAVGPASLVRIRRG
ncbi:DNA polymerase IV [Rhizocola hellebori]|uniref:DNA polymerase IV n=1 Tax=Rhizocola hellebori TaxID=1392758 RepID=A0A8J3Q6I6_9ACTN|nr:DNA polymerase IV [Rhizocola hellebori]GIH04740.1 DNA polymerase IV [Rhizocola hellebori]